MIFIKVGVIDVGGGLRGIYAAGIFDYCIDKNINFDLGIGVSAGSANIASYAAKQYGRNYTFYTKYIHRSKYMSLKNIIRTKAYIDLDYVYSTLSDSNGENPLNYKSIIKNPMEFYVVATNAITGEPTFFNKNNISQDDYTVLKASSSIPVVCTLHSIKGIPYFDGGISNPIPIKKAFDEGCDKVILILTKPKEHIDDFSQDEKLAKLIEKKYPNSANALLNRSHNYNLGLDLAMEYENEDKVLIIAPNNTCGVKTLTKNTQSLNRLYKKGYRDARQIKEFIEI